MLFDIFFVCLFVCLYIYTNLFKYLNKKKWINKFHSFIILLYNIIIKSIIVYFGFVQQNLNLHSSSFSVCFSKESACLPNNIFQTLVWMKYKFCSILISLLPFFSLQFKSSTTLIPTLYPKSLNLLYHGIKYKTTKNNIKKNINIIVSLKYLYIDIYFLLLLIIQTFFLILEQYH